MSLPTALADQRVDAPSLGVQTPTPSRRDRRENEVPSPSTTSLENITTPDSYTESETDAAENIYQLILQSFKANRRTHRAAIRFPTWEAVERAYEARRREPEYWRRVRTSMNRVAMRTLNELTKADQPLPSVEVFALALRWVIEDRATVVDGYELATGGGSRAAARGLVESAPERLGHSVAAFILAEHKPGFIKAKVAEGRTGGENSRRFIPAMLDGLEGLSIRKQARAVGCSVGTVATLRQAHPHYAR